MITNYICRRAQEALLEILYNNHDDDDNEQQGENDTLFKKSVDDIKHKFYIKKIMFR